MLKARDVTFGLKESFAHKELEDLANEKQQMSEEEQEQKACEAWKEHLQANRSIVVDLFQGQLKSTLKCLKCNYVSIKFDSFMYLSVPIPYVGG